MKQDELGIGENPYKNYRYYLVKEVRPIVFEKSF